jgi:hypothetical protein
MESLNWKGNVMIREELINEINLIQDLKIRTFVKETLNNTPDYFFTAPASSTGKHHPACTNGKRGLLVHVQRAVYFANRLCSGLGIVDKQRDIVLAGTILHDIAKVPNQGNNFDNYVNHPINALKYLASTGDENLTREISNCIQYHMGLWSPEQIKKPIKQYTLTEITVYLADYLATTKDTITPVDEDQKKGKEC